MFPKGFSGNGIHCGIKTDSTREDVSLILADSDCTAVGVYTQNRVVAAPVLLDRERTPSDRIRAVVINSGNANACTGERGMQDATQMCRLAAEAGGVSPDQVLVLSTGIIGEHLPMNKISDGIKRAASGLDRDEAALIRAARGMMTTDTRQKVASRRIELSDQEVHIVGMAKGAAMIGPDMATMLAVLLTDARLTAEAAQRILRRAVDDSFNCISVEGHTSTNDTVLLLANGTASGRELVNDDLEIFAANLLDVCVQLAREIPNDGEGATHLIEVDVTGCRTRDDAHRIASAIANSPLVKTAVAGADPNWGRIVSAAGYAGVEFDPAHVELLINQVAIYRAGVPLKFDAEQVSRSIRDNRNTHIRFQLQEGQAAVRFWTCDLTAEYVRLNADYHT